MSAYDYNPSICLEVFHGIVKEIPWGVRLGTGAFNMFLKSSYCTSPGLISVPINVDLLAIHHSGRDLRKICPKIKFTQELLSYIRNTIISATTKAIDWLWNTYDVPEKLKCLAELEQKYPKNVAWRPKTGEVNLNSIIARNLLKRKMELIKQIELVREESAMIMPYLKTFSDQAKDQLQEIVAIEEKYSTTT